MAKATWTVYELIFQGKSYIGITSLSLQARLRRHIGNINASKQKHRPLYAAMRSAAVDLSSRASIHALAEGLSKKKALTMEQASIKKKDTLTPRGWNVYGPGSSRWLEIAEQRKPAGLDQRNEELRRQMFIRLR